MPTSPASQEAFALEIRRIYVNAERIMLGKVAKRIARGIDEDGWAERKLAETRAMRQDVETSIKALRGQSAKVEDGITEAYAAGSKEAAADIAKIRGKDPREILDARSKAAIGRLTETAIGNLESTHFRILRSTMDAYRAVIAEASEQVLTGTVTRREAAQVALNRFADKGITGFVDKAGRNWDLASYAEMATRTATGQAAVQGHLDRLVDNDEDLVIVSGHEESCPLCDPWEGQILSISGNNPDYPSVADAEADGLLHPNCTHTLDLYVGGLTREVEKKSDGGEAYKERQQQRYNERQIRRWKLREEVAITEKDAAKAKAKISEWQARQREFIAETDRRRDYARESVARAR